MFDIESLLELLLFRKAGIPVDLLDIGAEGEIGV
jgi:hypothetical protein